MLFYCTSLQSFRLNRRERKAKSSKATVKCITGCVVNIFLGQGQIFGGGKMMETDNIFLFVPNIIGYGRVILALISFYFMPSNHVIASWCYIISALLDAVDGHAARYFNQGTKFGAMLDQLTDRVGTMCLLATLCVLYPSYTFWFQLSMAIDIACHWIYVHASLLQGKTSHKFIDMSENPIMNVYYTNRTVLFIMCAGNEAFYAALYLVHFTEGPILAGISLFRLIMYISAPIAIIKAGISLLHGYVACINLSIIDLKERQALKANKSLHFATSSTSAKSD